MNEHWIYGTHAVSAALKNPLLTIHRLLIVDNHSSKSVMLEQAKKRDILITMTKARDLDAKLPQLNHQGVALAIDPLRDFQEHDLDSLLTRLDVPARLLVLDGVVDPHNLGACLRVADAAGVHAVIAPKDRACGLTPVVRKVACGAAESVPFIQVTNLARTLRWLKEQGVWLYGLAGEATENYTQADFKSSVAIVMGAEGSGLRRITAECCDYLIRIPMLGCVESLNVSVATGIVLYEAVRQGESG